MKPYINLITHKDGNKLGKRKSLISIERLFGKQKRTEIEVEAIIKACKWIRKELSK